MSLSSERFAPEPDAKGKEDGPVPRDPAALNNNPATCGKEIPIEIPNDTTGHIGDDADGDEDMVGLCLILLSLC